MTANFNLKFLLGTLDSNSKLGRLKGKQFITDIMAWGY
jgi:hypothetical protein